MFNIRRERDIVKGKPQKNFALEHTLNDRGGVIDTKVIQFPDVEGYIKRRRKKGKKAFSGSEGAEIWWGNKAGILNDAKMDALYTQISVDPSGYKYFPYNNNDFRKYLCLPIVNPTDKEYKALCMQRVDSRDPNNLPVVLDNCDSGCKLDDLIESLSNTNVDDVRNRKKPVNILVAETDVSHGNFVISKSA